MVTEVDHADAANQKLRRKDPRIPLVPSIAGNGGYACSSTDGGSAATQVFE